MAILKVLFHSKENEILMKVEYVGMCGSDIHGFEFGPFIPPKDPNQKIGLGHEVAGEVAGIGAKVTKFKVGDGVTIQAYSPLEMGLLSGTMPRDYKPVGAQIPKKWFQPDNMQAAMDMMDKWKPLCEKYDCTIANLALGWILAQGDFLNLLSGSTTVEQIKENVKSAELELDPKDVAYMRELAEEIDK